MMISLSSTQFCLCFFLLPASMSCRSALKYKSWSKESNVSIVYITHPHVSLVSLLHLSILDSLLSHSLVVQMRIIPQCFGQEVKPESCTVNRTLYTGSCESFDPSYELDPFDAQRSVGRDWSYLLKGLQAGPLVSQVKGKQIVIASGFVSLPTFVSFSQFINQFYTKWLYQHAVTISLGLEANIQGFLRPEYDAMIAQGSTPGPNKDRAKAELLRCFKLPAQYSMENSSPNMNRQTGIHVAWISDKYVWALLDFSRFTRIAITSRNSTWTQDDLTPGSQVSDLHILCHPLWSIHLSTGICYG